MMNKAMEWLRAYWPRIPADIRRGLLMAFVTVVTAFAVLAWNDGYRPRGMDKLLTKETSRSQLDTLQARLETGRTQAIEEALAQYNAGIMGYLSTERALGVDTLVKPAVEMLFTLDKRVRTIERSLKVTNDKMDQLPHAYEEQLRRIIDDRDRTDNTAALLNKVLQRLDEQDAANQAMQEQLEDLRTGKRVSKGKF